MFTPFQFGKYYLTERIAVGGMAELFKAKLYGVSGFEKQMAVKQILPKYSRNDEFIKMFIDEAKIAVNLHHGNIVPIYELGRIDGVYFIAMEFVDGQDLAEILARARATQLPLTPEHAVYIAIEICKGLDHAHRQTDAAGDALGVIHRDISPPNIMISMQGEVKITDFGIAKAAHKLGHTEAGVVKGTFGYMSPEQVRGLPVDHRTDIFSAGVLLWEMLTARRLFVGESEVEAIERVKEARIPSPSSLNPQVPQALDPIVLKALAKDSLDRYPDANELHLALSRFLYSAGTAASAATLSRYVQQLFERPAPSVSLPEEELAHSRPDLRNLIPPVIPDEELTARTPHQLLQSVLAQPVVPLFEEETSRSNPQLKDLESSHQPRIESSSEAKLTAPVAGNKQSMDVAGGKGIKINATLALPSLPERVLAAAQPEPLDKLVIEAAEGRGLEELEEEKTGVYYGTPGPKRPNVPELRFPPKEERVPRRRGPSELSEVLEAELPPSAEPPRSGVFSDPTVQASAIAETESGPPPFAESETPVVSVAEVSSGQEADDAILLVERAQPSSPDLMSLLGQSVQAAEPAGITLSQRPSTTGPQPLPPPPGLDSTSAPGAAKTRASKVSGIFSNTMRLFVAGLDSTQTQPAIDVGRDPSAVEATIDTDSLDRVPRIIRPTVFGWALLVLLVLGAGALVLHKKTAIFGGTQNEDSELLRAEDLKAQQVAPTVRKGTIILRSDPPGASFFRFVGETPLKVEDLDPGLSHLFLVEREGYSLVYRKVSGAELGGDPLQLQVQLNPVGPGSHQDPPELEQGGSPTGERRALQLDSQPPMAMVWRFVGDSEQVALTDLDIGMSVDIKALLPGYRPGITHISSVDFQEESTTFSTVIRLERSTGAQVADGAAAVDGGEPAKQSDEPAPSPAVAPTAPSERPRPRRRRPPRRAPSPKLQTPSWAR